MNFKSSFFIVLLLISQLLFSVANGEDPTPVPQRGVDRLRIPLNKNVYSVPRHVSNRFFELLIQEIAVYIKLDNTCPVDPHLSLYAFDDDSVTVMVIYGGPDDAEAFSVCSNKLFLEAITIKTALSTSQEFNALGFELTRPFQHTAQSRAATCFNGVKDNGEIGVDCGGDACDFKCLEHSFCAKGTDCVQECFANVCQYLSSGNGYGVTMGIVVGVVLAVFLT